MNQRLKPLVKVCGMRDPQNITQLLKIKPDYIGFILYPKSKRFIGDDYELEVDIPENIKRVGVFVNATSSEIKKWKNRLSLQLVQLHGSESPGFCREIQGTGIPVIKAFGIDEQFDFTVLKEYEAFCDYFLFDTKTSLYGGSGVQFDWKILKQYSLSKPFFLSGGIGPGDVGIHVKMSKLPMHAIDINSKFELGPGLKDITLLQNFITEFRK